MREINQDVLDINDALNRYRDTSESVGYEEGSIAGLYERRDTTLNPDDREAYADQIQRQYERLEIAKSNRTQAREDVKRAFEHYYS